LSTFLRTTLVSSDEFWKAFHEVGAVYFIRDAKADAIKVGHSRDPHKRLSDLQVGSSAKLELIGVIAAAKKIEPLVHRQLFEGHIRGEWFYDRGVTSQWLLDMTQSEPMYRHVWKLVPGREFIMLWDPVTNTHTKHVREAGTDEWVPPFPQRPSEHARH
jgi:Meiotically up-regulated gene 113